MQFVGQLKKLHVNHATDAGNNDQSTLVLTIFSEKIKEAILTFS